MAGPFLATITIHQDLSAPVDPGYGVPAPPQAGGPVDPGYGVPEPPPQPSHPIVIPPDKPDGPPDIIWPSPPHPEHPIVIPEPPGGGPPIVIGPHPEHPIVLPTPPDVIWPPDVSIEHPIVLPLPPECWPDPPVYPSHPIVIPPTDPERRKLFTWKTGWSEKTGWVVIAIPNFPHPAPSAAVATQKAPAPGPAPRKP